MKHLTVNNIVRRSMDIFKSRNLANGTLNSYVGIVRKLKDFMYENSITIYDEDVGRRFYKQIIEKTALSDSAIMSMHRTLRILDAMVSGKYLPPPTWKIKGVYKFKGEFGAIGKRFIEDLRCANQLSPSTCGCYSSAISRFCERMELEGVTLMTISREDIVKYVSSRPFKGHSGLVPIKRFLKHLYEIGAVGTNYEDVVHPFIRSRQVLLPSVYDDHEIMRIEKAINRITPIGKRNYAIVLLASRLGLRASDISGLRFSNLDWDRNIIDLRQLKTKQNVVLPLLPAVGNAIIDYVRNGRPHTDSKNIFVAHSNGHGVLKSGSISSIVSRYILTAGLDVSRRHHGSHSLRHSLATQLLGNGITLPVISDILGQESQESTKVYLGVNVSQLIETSLVVPLVNENFYRQEGGFFYE